MSLTVDKKKEGFRGRCFYFFRIKEDKRRWGRKEGGENGGGGKKKRMDPKKTRK